jgi:hypothetical protein
MDRANPKIPPNRELWVVWVGERREGKGERTHCQNVSGSLSCKHSGPKPNLNEETDHLARWPMSGHGNGGGILTAFENNTTQETGGI